MKKIIILLFILILVSGCTVKPGGSAGTESSDSTSVPTISGRYENPLSFEKICIDIDAYFRMYYANNQNYKWNRVAAAQRSVDGSYVTGYFDGDFLIKMVLETYGETKSDFTTYYFINESLIYCVHRINHQFPPPFQESYEEYFLVDGKLWQYNHETNHFDKSSDTSVIDYYEQDKYALIGDKTVRFVENTGTFPIEDNSFIQFNNAKKIYFRKFFAVEKYDLYKNSFHVDLLNSYSLPETERVNALF